MSETVGKYLKERREKLGISLEEVAEETKIQKRYLEELENDEFESLPGEAYVKGFLRNYSAAIKVNSDEVIELYKKMQNRKNEINEELEEESEEIDEIIPTGKVKKLNVAVLLLILILFIVGIFMIVKNRVGNSDKVVVVQQTIKLPIVEERKVEIPVEEEEKALSKPVIKQFKKPEIPVAAVTQPLTIGEKTFEIDVKGDSWLEIKEGKRIVFSNMVSAGDKKVVKSSKGVYIKAGKASNIKIKLNGQDITVTGDEKDVFRRTWK